MTQYSLFGAAAAAPSEADLDGLLLAGGQWVRSGPAARLSVVVGRRWRADALHDAFAVRDLADPDEPVVEAATGREPGFAVRTAFTARLAGAAARWTRGARQHVPADFVLTPGGLRLWAVAAGQLDDTGYLLAGPPMAPVGSRSLSGDALHRAAGAQLAALGVAALSLTRSGAGARPAWRVTSARRLRRLAELLGPPPDGAGADWPAPATAAH